MPIKARDTVAHFNYSRTITNFGSADSETDGS